MMAWTAILKMALAVAQYAAKRAADKQLIDAGTAIAVKNGLYDAQQKVIRADIARRNARVDSDSVSNDTNNRANK
jgi:hypothetical protein